MKQIKLIILMIILLLVPFCTQQVGFNDSVKLKNGTILENVKVTATKDSFLVTDSDGKTTTYTEAEVSEVKKNGARFSEEKKPANEASVQWSQNMGEMNWNDATAKCKSLGMRLPTKDELKIAYTTGVTKSWKREGWAYGFWSSTPYTNAGAYFINGSNGVIHYVTRDSDLLVRCVR